MSKEQKEIPFWPGVVLVAVVIPALFYFKTGKIDGVAIGMTAFLLLIVFGVEFIPKLTTRYSAEEKSIAVKKGKFDWLGGVWLLSIPFAPFALWAISSLTVLSPASWKMLLGIRAGLCVVIPCIAVLPLLRYLRGKAAPYALLILVIGTGFPVTFGWNSLLDFVQGPVQEQVTIQTIHRVHGTYKFRDAPSDILNVTLSDGRLLNANVTVVSPKEGMTKALILEHTGEIIAVE